MFRSNQKDPVGIFHITDIKNPADNEWFHYYPVASWWSGIRARSFHIPMYKNREPVGVYLEFPKHMIDDVPIFSLKTRPVSSGLG